MDFLEKLGIDWRLLIAQVLNFAILLFVLRRFAYQPIVKALNGRRERIAKAMAETQALEERTARSDEERRERLAQAEGEANLIVAEARQQADRLRAEMLDAAQTEVSAIRLDAASEARRLKEQALAEARIELAGLVVDATEKIIGEKMTTARDEELVRKTITELER